MKTWYFSKPDKKLAYGDGREIHVGSTHTVEGEPVLCGFGLHGSVRLIDALIYAESNYLYRVEIEDSVVEGADKICGKSRKYLAFIDAETVLRDFARKQVLINIKKIKRHCSENDYALILEWLNTGNESIRSAARSAACSAAYSAAYSAAWSAAESAARSVARSVAYSAARSVANEMLEQMVFTELEKQGYKES